MGTLSLSRKKREISAPFKLNLRLVFATIISANRYSNRSRLSFLLIKQVEKVTKANMSDSTKVAKPRRNLRGADSVKTRRQKVTAETETSSPVDDMDTLIATHRIQRGLSRVSVRKRKPTEMSKLEQLQLKGRDLQQELKDKHFQLRCIEQLLIKTSPTTAYWTGVKIMG